MSSSPFKNSVFWVALVVFVASLWVFNERREHRQEKALAKQQLKTQRAVAMLFRAFHTDNYLTYSALSTTTAHMGKKKMRSVARIIHAPQKLSIQYQSGALAGVSMGYNQHWTWRKAVSQPMIPYAELERPAEEMAAQRFALMLENYKARWEGNETQNGREVDVVQLLPLYPAEGAQGPARKLWIDAKTGLTLRQQSFNFMMMKVMESVLSDVNYEPDIDPDTFVTPQTLSVAAQSKPWMAHETLNDRERVAKLARLYPPEVKNLPTGFEFDGVGAHRCQSCDGACYAVLSRYTDGLNTLTVFALKPNCPLAADGVPTGKKSPSTSAEASLQSCEFGTGTLVMRNLPEAHLIAVADLPSKALQRVLESTVVQQYGANP
jgi:outer membrane lipoprotein-sorting protein